MAASSPISAARTRDVAGAEDALGEAFAAALRMWPIDGVPTSPDAWLLTVARRRHTDAMRRRPDPAGGGGAGEADRPGNRRRNRRGRQ